MRLNFSIWFSVLALFVTLTSCEDQKIPAPNGLRFRVKKVIPGNPLSGPYQFYKFNGDYRYNNAGQLVEGAGFALSYDENGRITKAEGIGKARKYYYSTDVNGRVIAALGRDDFSPNGEFTKEQYWLDYGDDTFPIKITKATGSPAAARQFTYSDLTYSVGNVVQLKVRIKNETETYDIGNYVQTLQYDNKPNPFYGLVFGDLDSRLFSKNNLLDNNYVYSYDANGLLTRITLNYDGSTVQTFEYETY